MKNLFPLFLLLITVTGCYSPIYQVARMKYQGAPLAKQPNWIDHGDLLLKYELWGEGGNLRCQLHNQTHQPLAIDLQRSSLIRNGEAFPYFESAYTDFNAVTLKGVYTEDLEGQAFTRFDQKRVTVPPHSYLTLEKFNLDYQNDTSLWVGANQVQSIDDPWHFQFRHYLVYYSEAKPDSLQFIDDAFVLVSAQLMGRQAFDQYRPGRLEIYSVNQRPDEIGTAASFLLLIGTPLALLAMLGGQH